MLFNSLHFLVFFPVVVLIFLMIPQKFRTVWLLAASYYFYMSWNPKYAVLIAFSIVSTYLTGLLLDRVSENLEERKGRRNKKLCVAVNFIINLGILFFFKYFDFALENVNRVLSALNVTILEKPFDVLLPVGISFYTFQALGYTVDVYRGNIRAEKNLINYALFVSFFPQLVAGPIERSDNLLIQIQTIEKKKLWNRNRIRDGLLLMLWGFFQKLMIADRAAIAVNAVYNQYQVFGGGEIVLATLLFAFQIYCDFDAYTNIARGAARVCGFELMANFRQPYFAVSIADFWRRWHISLSSWFRDYLYIPLGGSRVSAVRNWMNLMLTFLVSGAWHGASWHFILWGGLHGAYQVVGKWKNALLKKIQNAFGMEKEIHLPKILQIAVTFCLAVFAWMLFRVNSLSDMKGMLSIIVNQPYVKDLAAMNMSNVEWVLLAISLMILFAVDILQAKNISLNRLIVNRSVVIRVLLYTVGIGSIIIFGVYGVAYDASQFLYFQF